MNFNFPNYSNIKNNINRSNTSQYNLYNQHYQNNIIPNEYESYQNNSYSENNLVYNLQQRPMSSYQPMRYNNNV